MRLLFLDIDGVLNNHQKLDSGYCGMRQANVMWLNEILKAIPTLKIVVTSAWRYLVIRGDMNLKGLEYLLLTNGIVCSGRVHGITDADPEEEIPHSDIDQWHVRGLRWRADQIRTYAYKHHADVYVAVDDLKLDMPPEVFVQTDGTKGLTWKESRLIIETLLGKRT